MRSGPSVASRSSCAEREGAARRSVRLTMLPWLWTVDGAVRLVDEAGKVAGMPVIAAGLALVAVHALLHHGPVAVVGDEEPVQVEIEAVLHGRAVDLGDEAAGAGEGMAHRSRCDRRAPLSSSGVRRECLPRPPQTWMPSSPCQRRETALQCADHAGGDAGRMPVHAHDGAEGLEPEGMRQPPQEFIAAVVMDDGLADDGAERRHALPQPRRHAAAVERKISAACPSCHSGLAIESSNLVH